MNGIGDVLQLRIVEVAWSRDANEWHGASCGLCESCDRQRQQLVRPRALCDARRYASPSNLRFRFRHQASGVRPFRTAPSRRAPPGPGVRVAFILADAEPVTFGISLALHAVSNANHGVGADLDIERRRGPGRDADSHRVTAMPHRSAAPAGAIALDGVDHGLRSFIAPERDKHLIDHDVVENLESSRSEALGKASGVLAGPFDETADTRAAERLEGGPHLET